MTLGVDGPRLHEVARRDGLQAALAVLYRELAGDAVVAGPGGHAVVPSALAPAGRTVALTLLDRTGLVALRGLLVGRGGDRWLEGLAWLRLGTSRRLLDDALSYLGGRTVGGGPLLGQQLIKGAVADAIIEQLAVRALLDGGPPRAGLVDGHDRLTEADRGLLRLLGATGFTADGPGRMVYLSQLLADVYC